MRFSYTILFENIMFVPSSQAPGVQLWLANYHAWVVVCYRETLSESSPDLTGNAELHFCHFSLALRRGSLQIMQAFCLPPGVQDITIPGRRKFCSSALHLRMKVMQVDSSPFVFHPPCYPSDVRRSFGVSLEALVSCCITVLEHVAVISA